MNRRIQQGATFSSLFCAFFFLLPIVARGTETPTMVIEEAKVAIEQARKAGADKKASDDLSAANGWLARAEKEYAERKSLFSRAKKVVSSDKAKEEEIIYLAKMAKLKAMTAEAKSRKDATLTELKDVRKELADYQSTLEVLKKNLAEAEKIRQSERQEVEKTREIQARAAAERQEFAKAKQKAAELEEQKRRELEEAQKKMAALEAMKQKELQEARLKEAERAVEREKELTEAKLKAERLALQQAQGAAEIKAGEERLSAERQKLTALQQKTAVLERQRAMLADAGKIPQATVKASDKEIIITLLAIDLFTPANELKTKGKEVLDGVGNFLKTYATHKAIVRGHTDSAGSAATNQAISAKRAQKVREYLVAYQDILPTRITATGLGPSQPMATNATEAGRTLNRRVEIVILTGE